MKGAQEAKERPIIFSRPMVAALARGEKTQTRRVVNFEPLDVGLNMTHTGLQAYECIPGSWGLMSQRAGAWVDVAQRIRCPYGAVGDRLWVREPWRVVVDDGGAFVAYSDGDELGFPAHDDELRALAAQPNGTRNRHARYIPRWASRFLLEIVNIRVERVQAISEEDALAEGIEELDGAMDERHLCGLSKRYGLPLESSRCWFTYLWESIHGPGAWDRNDWVWVITFKRVDVPGGEP